MLVEIKGIKVSCLYGAIALTILAGGDAPPPVGKAGAIVAGSETTSGITVVPGGDGKLDFKNAKPLPLPGVTGPYNGSGVLPDDGRLDPKRGGYSGPGSTGTGHEQPQVVIPQSKL
jgi:hypothetical protein